MIDLKLQLNESVILQSVGVSTGGFMSAYTDELYLTNHNIIHVSKGMFGKVKKIDKYQLRQLKVFDGTPQVSLGESSNGADELQLYFKTEQKSFVFQNGKMEILKWIKSINEIVTGVSSQTLPNENIMAIPGTEEVAEILRDTIGKFKKTFQGNSNIEKVTLKCIGCKAPISGVKGTQVKCNYCRTVQTL